MNITLLTPIQASNEWFVYVNSIFERKIRELGHDVDQILFENVDLDLVKQIESRNSDFYISQSGIGSAIMLTAPLILTTYALTFIAMAGSGGVDLSIGPFMGFINVSSIQLYAAGYLQTPVGWFIYAFAMGLLWQFFYALIVCFVRVSPIIVSLAGYLAFAGINIVILPRPGGIAPDWLIPWGEGFTIFNEIFLLMILQRLHFI